MTTELQGTTRVSSSNQELAREIGNTLSPLEGAPGVGECFQAVLERQGSSHEKEASGDATGNILPADPHIRTLVLGPRIRIKTVADAVPDSDALLAFARAQGMSDAAIALIARVSGETRSSSPVSSSEQGGTDTLPTGVAVIPAQAESRVMAFPGVSNARKALAAWASPDSGSAAISAAAHSGTPLVGPATSGAVATGAGTETVTGTASDMVRSPGLAPLATRLPELALRIAEDGIGAIVTTGSTQGSTPGSNLRLAPNPAHSMPPFDRGVTRDGAAAFQNAMNSSSATTDTPLFVWTARITPGASNRMIASAETEKTESTGSKGATPNLQTQELLDADLAWDPGHGMFRVGTLRAATAISSIELPSMPAVDASVTAHVTGLAAIRSHQVALADATGLTSRDGFGAVDDGWGASGSRFTLNDVTGRDDARPSSAESAWQSPPEPPESKLAGETRAPDTSSLDALRTLDNYRQLSLKMAEAVGQRILGMLSRGEWQLALQLNPAHLGRVDVRLTMRGNRMVDAEFLSSRSDTVSLLASGESRLRACLDGAGFNTGQISSGFDSNLDNASRQARPGSQPAGNTAGSLPAAPLASGVVARSERPPPYILTPERLDVLV